MRYRETRPTSLTSCAASPDLRRTAIVVRRYREYDLPIAERAWIARPIQAPPSPTARGGFSPCFTYLQLRRQNASPMRATS